MNNIFLIIIIALLILFIMYCKKKHKKNEDFVADIFNEPILSHNVIESKIAQITIYKKEYDISEKLNRLVNHNHIEITNIQNFNLVDNGPDKLFYTDIISYNKNYKDKYDILTICTIPKVLLLFSRNDSDLTLAPLDDRVIRIAYLYEIDKEIIKNIIKSQKSFITFNKYEFIQIEVDDNGLIYTIEENLFNLFNYDIFVYFNTLTNPIFGELSKKNYRLVPYLDDIDKNILNISFPFYRKKIYTMSRLSSYERYDTSNTDTTEYKVSDFNDVNNIVYNSLHIDNLLMIKKQDVSVQRYSDDIMKDLHENYNIVLEHFNEYLKINYYLVKGQELRNIGDLKEDEFKFMDIVEDWSYEKQNEVQQIIEGFENNEKLFTITNLSDEIDVRFFNNAEIVSNTDVISYRVNTETIDDMPVKEGDEIFFSNKLGPFEANKKYYVEDVGNNYIILEDSIKIELENEEVNENLIRLSTTTINKYDLEINDSVYVLNYRKGLVVPRKDDEDDTEKLYILLEEIEEDNLGGEYITVKVQEGCDTSDNQLYNEKDLQIWDNPCTKNEDCPFYLKNKNYSNQRGGCNNGYCEFPVGLKRLGKRLYNQVINENNHPICRGCSTGDINCCERQENDINYNGPDYIFPDYI